MAGRRLTKTAVRTASFVAYLLAGSKRGSDQPGLEVLPSGELAASDGMVAASRTAREWVAGFTGGADGMSAWTP